MPHSHIDPDWLKIVEGYFATATKSIISNMVDKLIKHSIMASIWTEMSYLSMWWEVAQPDMKEKLRSLLDSLRLAIPTGGWVMMDEANVELYSMVEQLVEGHMFLRPTFTVKPKSHRDVSAQEEEQFEKGGGLKKRTVEDRAREASAFYEFFTSKSEGDKMEDLVLSETGREKISRIFSAYFFSMEVESGERPKKNYACKIKSPIKMQILEDKKCDITVPALFPRTAKCWKGVINKLAGEGRGDTIHKEESTITGGINVEILFYCLGTKVNNKFFIGIKTFKFKVINSHKAACFLEANCVLAVVSS